MVLCKTENKGGDRLKEGVSKDGTAYEYVDEQTGELKRIRLPGEGELLGVVEQMLGASRMLVRCSDGKTRIARVPGRIKRRMWIKEGDIVIVKPWIVQSDKKADIVYRYTKTQVDRLQAAGLINI